MPYGMIFDDLILDSAQVTNPSIDPLREEVETRSYLGRRSGKVTLSGDGWVTESDGSGPMVPMDMPLMLGHISLGAVSYNVQLALLQAAMDLNILAGSGEGGLHTDFNRFADHVVSEVASGRFGVTPDYLQRTAAVEIKIGQGAKPGVGGHLPGEKVTDLISSTRRIPLGTDALSPYPHHDIYSIEDLQQLIAVLKESTEHRVPVGVKIAAVHNGGAIASGVVRAGADFITLDGFRGGTGSSPRVIRDHAGLPIEVATAVVDKRLTDEGLRNRITLCRCGSIRSSADMIKAIALGADVASVCTSALIALGCQVCQSCHRGVCAWGITTQRPDLVSRLDPVMGAARVVRLYTAWNEELKEILGAMGIDSVESLVGNRDRLRYFGPNPKIAEVMASSMWAKGGGETMNNEYKVTTRRDGLGVTETHIDASGRDSWGRPLDQRALNSAVREAIANGATRIIIEGVMGQRYLVSATRAKDLYVAIRGTPGNDLGAFLDGPTVEVFGNAQDMTGNTMCSGRIVVHGNAGTSRGSPPRRSHPGQGQLRFPRGHTHEGVR
jgi:glutamate synthase domain-containing protein 2